MVMVPVICGWARQIRLNVPALSKVKLNFVVSPASSDWSMSRSSTVNVWNSVSAVSVKVTVSPTLNAQFRGVERVRSAAPHVFVDHRDRRAAVAVVRLV